MSKLTNKENKIISATLATWGIILISTGVAIDKTYAKPVEVKKRELEIIEKKVGNVKTNEIKLKDIELEIDEPISVDVKDYIENINNFDDETLKILKLDTSMVKNNEPGTYTYTITYNKKKYNGTIKIKEKELPHVDLTLNNLSLPVNSSLSKDIQVYVKEKLSDEIKENITINLSSVNTTQAGEYNYTITYNNSLYTGKITIYEPNPKSEIMKPTNKTDNDKEKDDSKTDKDKTDDDKEKDDSKTDKDKTDETDKNKNSEEKTDEPKLDTDTQKNS